MDESINYEFDYSEGEGPQELSIVVPSGEYSLEYYVPLNNSKECVERLKELVKIHSDDRANSARILENIAKFLGDGSSDWFDFLTFQEYEGPLNDDAISTFFKHAYCFVNDFDDKAVLKEEKYFIWLAGEGIQSNQTVRKALYHLGKVDAVFSIADLPRLSIPEGNVRISVWRLHVLV